MAIFYETERLILKMCQPEESKLVADYFVRNKNFLFKLEPVRNEDFFTAEFQEEALKGNIELYNKGEALRLWIYKKEDKNKIIGNVNFNNIVRGPFLSCFTGYRLDVDEVNKGYMTEALGRAIEVAFDELRLHRIEANIMPQNKPSFRVVEKLGFYKEGLAKKYLKINGVWEDHVHMVLLNENI